MDGSGQEGQRQMMDQQQQQGWYGAPQNPYQQHQPQAFKWQGYDPSLHYAQPPMQSFAQPEYYMQHQHYAPPHQQQPMQQPQQHGHTYAQQEQAWPSSNGWNQPQWNPQGTNTGSEEEDWAAKARAWAAAKAAQEAAQQAAQEAAQQAQLQAQAQAQLAQAQAQAQAQIPSQTSVQLQEQSYQDYQQPVPQGLKRTSETSQQSSLVPPGQEPTQGFAHDAPTSFRQDGHVYPQDPHPAFVQEDVPPSFGQDGASSAYTQAAHAQVVPSSYSQDVSSSYGQDTAISAPPGVEQQEPSNQKPSRPSVAPVLPQPQQSQLPAQVSPHTQSQQFPYQEPVPPLFEFHHQQFDYQQPPPQEYQQQPPAPYLPPGPPMGMDAGDMNFGGPPVWPPMGAQGLPFPPSIGPGGPGSHPGPQFDHPHHNHHHHHSHPMHGHQPPHMFPRPHGPPHGPGFRPGGPPLSGPFGFGGNPSLVQGPGTVGPVFMPEGNGNLGAPDRPKKAPVPSWLREELLKKKTAVSMSTSAVMSMSDDFVRINGSEPATVAAHKIAESERTRSDSSGISDNDEDDEEDTEAAKTAAMNQEIKRVLTEVLLKVTDDLFEEIAQEVMDEDETLEGQGEISILVETSDKWEMPSSTSPPSPPPAPALAAPARVLVAPAKQNRVLREDDESDSTSSGAPVGNVLGLATYASDEDDAERGARQLSGSVDLETSAEELKRKENAEDKSSGHRGRRSSREDISEAVDTHQEGGRSAQPFEEKERKDKKEKGAEREKDKIDGEGDRKDKERGRDREGRGKEIADENDLKMEQRSESKGRKRSNEDSNSSDQDTRSPRRARHAEIERVTNDTDLPGGDKLEAEPSGRQNKTGNSRRHTVDLKELKESTLVVRVAQKKAVDTQFETPEQSDRVANAVHVQASLSGKDNVKTDVKQEKHSKVIRGQSTDGSSIVPSGVNKGRVESADIIVKKNRDNEDGSKDRDRVKHRSRDGEKDRDDKVDRSREKEKARDRDKENERSHEKEKTRDYERGADRERSKGEREKDRGRIHERDRRKVDKDQSERGRDRRRELRDSRRSRRRSSSTSSRARSRSRSPSGSHGTSSGGDRSTSPKKRRQPRRLSRRQSLSRSPVRSRRRRLSRSRSRSPPSKYSHRRHSPSPSRETERRR